ncbi:MAG: TauD/TfdA family dioxygenase [Phenylobacterium sp.]|uniref:TauD/TfdA dioxygenase family protein n=2 Tax=Phenylobacterium sp. TaxID=1871053 RepID=UPI0025E17B75|nr:TauD/TfdA family dioxygenase [Phenylobacterium sp.]MCA3730242.1 TauD/TfdA family dioxygenase [Phenylobacterium sp.]MCA6245488.1 TauD/TfdA family dioxygenase [Phenylobacterium sp.]MCA6256166.1 TauD/TfdA family dioxygenase [Phenylobacterium sp.]
MSVSQTRRVRVAPEASGFGARITGVDLSQPLDPRDLEDVRAAWARHSVVCFPGQPLSLDALEAFTLQIGPFGKDPYIEPMPGRPNVLELRRQPDEKASNFGAGWHSDWSFLETPPAATLLRAQTIPPVGGDTLFVDASRAWVALSDAMKAVVAPLQAVHSARQSYGTKGVFARDTEARTMKIIVSEEADSSLTHPLVRTHPVTGRKALYISPVYTVGIEGFTPEESQALLGFLFAHLTREEFIYRHRWTEGDLLMWDNRCTMHFAEGGYDGHLRVMHRTTVQGEVPV